VLIVFDDAQLKKNPVYSTGFLMVNLTVKARITL